MLQYVIAGIVLFHPLPLTILVAVALVIVLRRTGLWARYKLPILAGAALLYAIDAAIALPRVLYAWNSPKQNVVERPIPLPQRIVLVGLEGCGAACHKRLLAGEIEEVIHIALPAWSQDQTKPITARSYKAEWVVPGTCPHERRPPYFRGSEALAQQGFCPRTELVEIPTEGVFVVREHFLVPASQRAQPFKPRYLVDGPPGRLIDLEAVEVQVRRAGKVEVVAHARSYAAPGFLGLPPLVGCWVRPENIIWTMPPGDMGCGLWRWFTGGGVRSYQGADCVFDAAFSKPDRIVTPPLKPALPPPTPAQALEILRNGPASVYLAGVKDALVAPDNSDEALIEMVLRSERRGELDGALLAWLAQKRRAVALAIPRRMPAPPFALIQAGALVTALAQDADLRAAYTDFMFDALSARWPGDAQAMLRFLGLIESDRPGWLCAHLDQVTREGGLLQRRDKTTPSGATDLPDFARTVIEKAVPACGEPGLTLLWRLLASPSGKRREAVSLFIADLPPEISAAMRDQALANLLDEHGPDDTLYRGAREHYVLLQARILLRAGLACADVASRVESALEEKRRQGTAVAPQLAERLALLSTQGDKQMPICRAPKQWPQSRP